MAQRYLADLQKWLYANRWCLVYWFVYALVYMEYEEVILAAEARVWAYIVWLFRSLTWHPLFNLGWRVSPVYVHIWVVFELVKAGWLAEC